MIKTSTRDKIIAAARSAFLEFGFEAATMQGIRARADISNGSLFHFFPTKEDAAAIVFAEAIHSYQAGFLTIFGNLEPAAEKAVRAAVRWHLSWVAENRDLARFLFEYGRPGWAPAFSPEIRDANAHLQSATRAWLTHQIERGRLKPTSAEVLMALIIGPAQVLCRAWLAGRSETAPTDYESALADAAWSALSLDRASKKDSSRSSSASRTKRPPGR
jgi:AcrR family transcriptional regulator